jgi:hypothetical protein
MTKKAGKISDKRRLDFLCRYDVIYFRNKWPIGSEGDRRNLHQVIIGGVINMVENASSYRQAIDAAIKASRARGRK